MKNHADLGGCYTPLPLASVDDTFLYLHNFSHHTQSHSIIKINIIYITFNIIQVGSPYLLIKGTLKVTFEMFRLKLDKETASLSGRSRELVN